MPLLTDEIAKILDCKNVKSLRDLLNHPSNRIKVLKALQGKKVRTTYSDRNGMRKTFFIDGITHLPAASLLAYGSLPSPYNISVVAHYYSRHRLRVQLPYLPCVIQRNKKNSEKKYYPLELLQLVNEPEDSWMKNLYKEIGSTPNTSTETLFTIGEDEEMDLLSGRELLSQTNDDDGW